MNTNIEHAEFFGRGSIANIVKILKQYKASDVFLVTGGASFGLSGAENVLMPFLDGCRVNHFSGFTQNPTIEDVATGIEAFCESKNDIVIAVGGGSAIDAAKLINVLASQPSKNYTEIVTGKQKVVSKGLPLIAIPTTSGSGSEATRFAVVTIDGRKFSLAHSFTEPDHSILDPYFTDSMPKYLAACSGMDALSQAVESFWSVTSTDESRNLSTLAIRKILGYIDKSVNNGDKTARDNMMKAANLAGKAINITKTTAPHAISYPITTCFNVPHGHAVALTLGKFFLLNVVKAGQKNVTDKRGEKHLAKAMKELFGLFDCLDGMECCDRWYWLMSSIGLETDFSKLGICDEKAIELIHGNIDFERLSNHPVKVDYSLIEALFNQRLIP
jgi:alcohol dehydrogenase class IV